MWIRYGLMVIFSLCPPIRATDDSQDIPTVQTVVGMAADIPCSVATPLEDDETSLILWYKMDSPNPIYTLDVRNVPIREAPHFPGAELMGRSYFNVTVHPPVLTLFPTIEEDNGDYKCRVDLKKSRTLILHSRLDLIAPPGEPIIMDEHGQWMYGVVGPFDEGSDLKLVCEVDGGHPSPEVNWWQGDVLIDDSYNATKQGFVRNEIILNRLRRKDFMANFTCKAQNTNLTQPKEASLQLDMNLYSISTEIISSGMPFVAGRPEDIVCETIGSRPRALTTWWLGGHKIAVSPAEDQKNATGNMTSHTLTFHPTHKDNGKKLECRSVNPVLPNSTLKAEMQLQVQYPPILDLILAPGIDASGIEEGVGVRLLCHADANPWISHISWLVDGRPISTTADEGVFALNRTLLFRRVQRRHRGRYKCSAQNEVGFGESGPLELDVKYAPVCKSVTSTVYTVAKTEAVNFTCEVDANPSTVSFRWLFNSSLASTASTQSNRTGNDSVFHYSPITDTDYGVLLCWARNVVNEQKNPCIFELLPVEIPESPHSCTPTNHTAHSFVVECQLGRGRGLSQMFHMEVFDSKSEVVTANMTNVDHPTFFVDKLVANTAYVIVIYSSNVKGRSKPVDLVATTLASSKEPSGNVDEPALPATLIFVIISVGVSMGFLITLVIAISIVRSRNGRVTFKKDLVASNLKAECQIEKKELDEIQDGKGPDIIPLSKESEVFYTDVLLDDPQRVEGIPKDSPPTEFIRLKYMHTVL